jgi:hypothetical protein
MAVGGLDQLKISKQNISNYPKSNTNLFIVFFPQNIGSSA